VEFRYLVVEGPPGAGKSVLTDRLGTRLDATVVLDEMADNPFLPDAQAGRPGAAFQAQLFGLLGRHRQLGALRQGDLFSQRTVCDYLFDRDKIYAYLGLDDNELFVYQRLYDLLVRDVPVPDLIVYLQAPADVLWRRLRQRARAGVEGPAPDEGLLGELTEAYNHFFFHYSATPLLVVETSHVDLSWTDVAVDDVLAQIEDMAGGTRYFVPRAE
jgi:deoxyadenosine/deoxycytidine kinase